MSPKAILSSAHGSNTRPPELPPSRVPIFNICVSFWPWKGSWENSAGFQQDQDATYCSWSSLGCSHIKRQDKESLFHTTEKRSPRLVVRIQGAGRGHKFRPRGNTRSLLHSLSRGDSSAPFLLYTNICTTLKRHFLWVIWLLLEMPKPVVASHHRSLVRGTRQAQWPGTATRSAQAVTLVQTWLILSPLALTCTAWTFVRSADDLCHPLCKQA